MGAREEQHSLKSLPTVARLQGQKLGIQPPRVADLGRLCPESSSALQPGLHTLLSPHQHLGMLGAEIFQSSFVSTEGTVCVLFGKPSSALAFDKWLCQGCLCASITPLPKNFI